VVRVVGVVCVVDVVCGLWDGCGMCGGYMAGDVVCSVWCVMWSMTRGVWVSRVFWVLVGRRAVYLNENGLFLVRTCGRRGGRWAGLG
jgi:hypothetical protein